MRANQELVRQAARQHGLLTRSQLFGHGVNRRFIDRRLVDGSLERVRRSVYRLAGSPASWEQDLLAACLAIRTLSVASHRSALRLWGLRDIDDEFEVTIRYPADVSLEGVLVHRSVDMLECDRTWVNGVPTTSIERTLIDAGLVFPAKEVRRIVARSLTTHLVARPTLWALRQRVAKQGRNGIGTLVEALESLPASSGSVSGPELEVRAILQSAGLESPTPQFPVDIRGKRYYIDMAYPTAKIAIEYDGYYEHIDPETFENDRRRQNAMQLAGWRILRFSKSDIRNRPEAIASEVARCRRQVL